MNPVKSLVQKIRRRPPPPPVEIVEERPKTELGEVQRRIGIYLRALWGVDFALRAIPRDSERPGHDRPYIEYGAIYLPAALYHDDDSSPLDTYRAAAAHAAAHLMYSRNPIPDKLLDKWQKAVIGAVEDARVETLAMRNFPGLRQLWLARHTASPADGKSAGAYLDRLARALLDENYEDDDAWIAGARASFQAVNDLEAAQAFSEIGKALAQSFPGKLGNHASELPDAPSVSYRDDNRYLWESAHVDDGKASRTPTVPFTIEGAVRRTDEVAAAGENATKGRKLLRRKLKARKVKMIGEPWKYHEWDFRSQSDTPDWVTLRELTMPPGDVGVISDIIARNVHLAARMKLILNAIRYGSPSRIRKLEEGDEVDINAAIRAQVDVKLGRQHDPRVMMRAVRKNRDISVLVLVDLSRSMNLKVEGQEQAAIDLMREVCALFADALYSVGDAFAIHGFCSESRHYVEYFRLKDFGQPYNDTSKSHLAGMIGNRSTRIGAPIRHATHYLNEQKSGKKLLMIVTDGEPTDIDVSSPNYLIYDAKRAVEDAGRDGISTYCIGLDPDADRYISRIFGAKNYIVVDHVKCLPEKMLMLYARLTR
ncbi:MAG: VWA domain-containing protein [Gallionellaceae bacterium]|jgi:hypothetical protein|nr:VWA domain-containing protein [Gallionellaceae bacterium]